MKVATDALSPRRSRRRRTPRAGTSQRRGPVTARDRSRRGHLRLSEVRFRVGGVTAYVGAGEPLASVDHAQEVVRHSFELAGAIGLVLALLAAYLIGTRVDGADPPLGRDRRPHRRRRPQPAHPVCPPAPARTCQALAEALNHMLDRLSTAFAAQREFVADASHELRTPLTVLRGQLDVLTGGDRDDGSLSAAELERVQRLMEAEIARLTRLRRTTCCCSSNPTATTSCVLPRCGSTSSSPSSGTASA